MKYLSRELRLPLDKNIILFGARNTGKSTLLKHTFDRDKSFWIDLLKFDEEDKYRRNPNLFIEEVQALPDEITHIIVDEIQKLPKLLNAVHYLIETTDKKFVLTGSSARKLKAVNINLLAGRAFVYNLYPLSYKELGEKFNLEDYLCWGGLPAIYDRHESEQDRRNFLNSYTNTYLKEEILYEQFVRKIDPFQRFLEVAAQANGEIINYANISNDVGIDDKTVKNYFSLLEETLVGFSLEAYDKSIRKRVSQKPKFYFFDVGIVRAITRQLSVPLTNFTSEFGKAFEHFIVTEAMKLASYAQKDFKFSYLRTKDGAEIDLVVERPNDKILFVEIKSSEEVNSEKLNNLRQLTKDHKAEGVCFSRDKHARKSDNIVIYPWKDGLKKYFS